MTPHSLKSVISAGTSDWIDYYDAAWRSSGSPGELAPIRLFDEPKYYGDNVYAWLEARYASAFDEVFKNVLSGLEAENSGNKYRSFWNAYFDPWSLWKQLIPLFAFSSAFDRFTESHIHLASAYVVGQGVPSKAVDDVLDTIHAADSESRLVELAPFCLISYGMGLEMIRAAGIPGQAESTFVAHSKAMYEYMWQEFTERFLFPEGVSDAYLSAYVEDDSRILSSVFYSITIEWAFALAGEDLGPVGRGACMSLRKVRQLNDEIIDAEEDLLNGIATYPILYSLSSAAHKDRMRRILAAVRQHDGRLGDDTASVLEEFRSVTRDVRAFPAAALESFKQLRAVMSFAMDRFRPEQAFAISLLINQRLTVLLKRADNDWGHVPDEYRPQLLDRLKLDRGL